MGRSSLSRVLFWRPCLDCKRPNLMTEGFYRANGQFLEFAEDVLPLFRKNYELVKAFSAAMGPKLKGGDYHFTTQAGALVGILEQIPREELVQMRDAALAAKQEGTPEAVTSFLERYPALKQYAPRTSSDLTGLLTLILTFIFGMLAWTKDDPKSPQEVLERGLSAAEVQDMIEADKRREAEEKRKAKNRAKKQRKERR